MHTALKLAAVTTLMLAAVAACGKKESGSKAGEAAAETTTTSGTTPSAATTSAKASCNMVTELGTCNEYRTASGLGLEKSLCEGFHGKFSNTGCPSDAQIGACTMSDGEVKRYYGTKVAGEHALALDEAKSDCESELVKGKFAPDPNAAAANEETPKVAAPVLKSSPVRAVIEKK